MNIQVVARIRPLIMSEFYQNNTNVIQQINSNTIQITNQTNQNVKQYSFDSIYNDNDDNIKIFNDKIINLVDKSLLKGYNSTILVYGQTASGKTYTVSSQSDSLIWQIGKRIYQIINENNDKNITIQLQMIEIYNEQIRDLLSFEDKKLFIRENKQGKVQIVNSTIQYLQDYQQFKDYIQFGINQSSFASTEMNEKSSRSHVIYKFQINQQNFQSNLIVVDLAGSERLNKTNVDTKQRLREANNINLSLQVLNLCINKLSQGDRQHIPYRDSNLTRILQNSLGGDSLTLIIGCLSPASNNTGESISTCQFMQLAKKIINTPQISKNFQNQNQQELKQKIIMLEQQIQNFKEQKDQIIPEIDWEDEAFQFYMDLDDIEKIRHLKQQIEYQDYDNASIVQSINKLKELSQITQEIKEIAQKQKYEQQFIQKAKQEKIEAEEDYLVQQKLNIQLKTELQNFKEQNQYIKIDQKQIYDEIQQFNYQQEILNTQLQKLIKTKQQQENIIENFIPKNEIQFYKRQNEFENQILYCKNIMKEVRKILIEFPQGNTLPMTNQQRFQKIKPIKIKKQIVQHIGDDEPSISIYE